MQYDNYCQHMKKLFNSSVSTETFVAKPHFSSCGKIDSATFVYLQTTGQQEVSLFSIFVKSGIFRSVMSLSGPNNEANPSQFLGE